MFPFCFEPGPRTFKSNWSANLSNLGAEYWVISSEIQEGASAMEGFECNQEDFEVNSESYRKPL